MLLRFIIYLFSMLVGLFSIGLYCGISPLSIMDLASSLCVLIFPIILMGILNGWKNVCTAFGVLSKRHKEKDVLIMAKCFFKNYGKIVFFIGVIASLISFVGIMRNLNTPEKLGFHLTLTILTILYAGIINLAIIPYKVFIDQKLL